jgi:protein-tyrosine phosphatase
MKKAGLIDLHTHVVYGLDDGSSSLDESIAMLRQAYAHGTRLVVASPHDSPEGRFQLDRKKFDLHLSRILNELYREKIDIKILKGSELKLNSRTLDYIIQKQYQVIEGTKLVLIECTLASVQHSYVNACLDELHAQGMIPLIAHVERYFNTVQEARIQAQLWSEQGFYLQINRESILAKAPKRQRQIALTLIKEGYVHVIASDAHHYGPPRDMRLDDSYAIIKRYFNQESANLLHCDNPQSILDNQRLNSPKVVIKPSLYYYLSRLFVNIP